MNLKKIFLIFGVLLFSLVMFFLIILFAFYIEATKKGNVKLTEGIYICDSTSLYGVIDVREISEFEFNQANGINVVTFFKENEQKYFSLNFYILFDNSKDVVFLEFKDLEVVEDEKFGPNIFSFCDSNNNFIVPYDGKISISYNDGLQSIHNSFIKK